MPLQIVLDTNVLVAALRSKRGASFRLLSLIGQSEKFEINSRALRNSAFKFGRRENFGSK